MAFKRISVKKEYRSGRNKIFRDNISKEIMPRSELVKKIEQGNYDNYHIRIINGIKTPVSNPDNSKNNNLD